MASTDAPSALVWRCSRKRARHDPDEVADSTPSDFAIHRHKLYFLANDGTPRPRNLGLSRKGLPQMVADIAIGTYGSNASGLRAINDDLLLAADSGEGYGQELYRLVPSPVMDDDEDGLPDDWEVEHGLDPALPDAVGDLDGDGVSNGADLNGTFRLTWPSVPGKTYLVSADSGAGWEPSPTVRAAPAPASQTVLKLAPPAGGRLLFRVSVSAE